MAKFDFTPHLYGLIANALKCEGTYDPERVLPHFEEHLTGAEHDTLHRFLKWVHDNGRPFGHGTYLKVFAEWRKETGS